MYATDFICDKKCTKNQKNDEMTIKIIINMSTEVFYEAEEDDFFQIKDEIIIDRFNDKTFQIKMSFRELCVYSTPWCYNRAVNEEKVTELYESLCKSYDIPFVLHAVHDEMHSNPISKILILDGQHRLEAIKRYIAENDSSFECSHKAYVHIYKINNAETENTDEVIELFKKINNHRVFNASDMPSTTIVDLVKSIYCLPQFNKNKCKPIKSNVNTQTCHYPNMHTRELNTLFNQNREMIENGKDTIEQLTQNIKEINHKISLIPFGERLYNRSALTKEKEKYDKAFKNGFFLNLKNSKYPKEEWIKFINNPSAMCQ